MRGVCYWETQDVSCKRSLPQAGKNEAIEENVPNKQTRQIPELFEVEIGNLAKKEFKVVIERLSKNLGKEWMHRARSYFFFYQRLRKYKE